MKKYDSYKDSGIKWIGAIPEHWSLKKIKHTTYVKGRIGWQGLRSDEFLEEAESLVVTGTDFIDGKINWKTCYQIPIERYNEDINIQLKENDLLITKDGTIGKVSLVKDMPKIATLNSGVFLTRPSTNDYITEYMYWVLVSELFKTFYDFNKSGSTIQHLYQYVFDEFNFTKPPLEEQTNIAKFLNHKTTQIDTLISKKQQFINLLQEERNAVINQAVTKGLDPNVPMKDSGIEWLGEIPEHWVVTRLGFLSSKIGDGLHGTPNYVDNSDFKFINGNNIGDGQISIYEHTKCVSEEEYLSNKKELNTNSILMSINGTIGNLGQYKGEKVMLGKSVAYINIIDSNVLNFTYKYLESESCKTYIDNQLSGSTIKNLSLYSINKIPIPFPNFEEQKKIVDYITIKTNEINTLISKSQQEIELLKEYKTALISEVVTGKVDVRNKKLS